MPWGRACQHGRRAAHGGRAGIARPHRGTCSSPAYRRRAAYSVEKAYDEPCIQSKKLKLDGHRSGILPYQLGQHGKCHGERLENRSVVGETGGSGMPPPPKAAAISDTLRSPLERRLPRTLVSALNALQEQADLHAHHRAHHIDQAVALIRGDTASLKVTLVRVAIRHAPWATVLMRPITMDLRCKNSTRMLW